MNFRKVLALLGSLIIITPITSTVIACQNVNSDFVWKKFNFQNMDWGLKQANYFNENIMEIHEGIFDKKTYVYQYFNDYYKEFIDAILILNLVHSSPKNLKMIPNETPFLSLSWVKTNLWQSSEHARFDVIDEDGNVLHTTSFKYQVKVIVN